MNTKYLKPLAVTLGLGLLPACPSSPSSTTEAMDTTQGTTGDATTGDPDVSTTTTGTPTSEPTTTGGTTTGDDSTTGDPTTGTTGEDTTTGPTGTLCERLGGGWGVAELVDSFLLVVAQDEKINGYFLNTDVDAGSLATMVSAQLGELAGCEGVVYGGLGMQEAHAGMGISAQDFVDFVADFQQALTAHAATHPELSEADQAAVLAVLGGFEAEIVEDPENNLTVYQRVGRKPAIKQMVGGPDDPASFIAILLADDAINTYFVMTDVVRFNTCLTRQLGDIDGPIQYGAEVDSPGPGIDEGASLVDPCRDMSLVHENLQDAAMTYITVDDFGAMMADLATAMSLADVSDSDQALVLAAVWPLCDAIVVGSEEKNKCPGNSKQETVELTALAQPLKDNAYDGSLDSMLCTDVVVAQDAAGIELVSAVELTLGLDHPWIGDVNVKIESPTGAILTVFNRPGNLVMPDDGTGCCNDNSDLSKSYPIVLKNGGMFDAAKMGTTIDAGKVICKDDKQCEFKPNHGSGPGTDFTDFLGETAAGTWKVCIGDSNAGDLGVLDHVGLTFTKVKYDPKL
ncbi:MAG TPA: hypothetical protein VGB85_31175 [Nannocystis sp.]